MMFSVPIFLGAPWGAVPTVGGNFTRAVKNNADIKFLKSTDFCLVIKLIINV